MPMDTAELKIRTTADIKDAQALSDMLEHLIKKSGQLGDTKGAKNLQGIFSDLRNTVKTLIAELEKVKIGKALDGAKTDKLVSEISSISTALKQAEAEAAVFAKKLNAELAKIDTSAVKNALAQAMATPIVGKDGKALSRHITSNAITGAINTVSQELGSSRADVSKHVKKVVSEKIGSIAKAPSAIEGIVVTGLLSSLKKEKAEIDSRRGDWVKSSYTGSSLTVGIRKVQEENGKLIGTFSGVNKAAQASAENIFKYGRRAAEAMATIRPALSSMERLDRIVSTGTFSRISAIESPTRVYRKKTEPAAPIFDPKADYINYWKSVEFSREQDARFAAQERHRSIYRAGNLRNRMPNYGRATLGADGYTIGNLAGAEIYQKIMGSNVGNPFQGGLKLETYESDLIKFLRNLTNEASKIPENVRKAAMADLKRLNLLSINRLGQTGDDLKNFRVSPLGGVGLTSDMISARFKDPNQKGDARYQTFIGQEQAFLQFKAGLDKKFRESQTNQPTYAPPKTATVAWGNLKDSLRQTMVAFGELNKQVEQPLASIAIAFSRIAYGLRTVQFGLMAFGATFSTVIGGATMAAKNLAMSILDLTEIQKKAEISLRGTFGDQGLAKDITDFARRYAIETPATFREVTQMIKSFGFIPQIKSQINSVKGDAKALDKTLEDLSYTTIALGLTKPEQGIEGAIFSIREALAGQFRSLKMRFEMPMSAVAATVGMTESQLKDDPKKMMEALKSFMDLNVGEDTIKRLYRTFSVQLQNIGDAFEKAKVRIGQSGFEERMEQMAYNIAKAFDAFIDTKEFENRAQKISDLMSKFGSKMVNYGFNVLGALVRPEDQSKYSGVKQSATGEANKLVSEGMLGKSDVKQYVDVQLLIAYGIDKLTVAYDLLLRVLDGVIPKVTNLIQSFVASKTAMEQMADNVIAFVNMLIDVGQGLLEIMNGIVTGINKMHVGPKTKALMLFFLAFPVATTQTILASAVGISKLFSVISTFATTGTLQVAGTTLLTLGTSIKQFVATITAASAASGIMTYIKTGSFPIATSVGATAAGSLVGATAPAWMSTLITGITAALNYTMVILRGGLVTGIVLAVGTLAEKLTGIHVGFTRLLSVLSTISTKIAIVAGWTVIQILSLILNSINLVFGAIKYFGAQIYTAYQEAFGKKSKEEQGVDKFNDLLNKRDKAYSAYLGAKNSPFGAAAIGIDIVKQKAEVTSASTDLQNILKDIEIRKSSGKLTKSDKAILAASDKYMETGKVSTMSFDEKVKSNFKTLENFLSGTSDSTVSEFNNLGYSISSMSDAAAEASRNLNSANNILHGISDMRVDKTISNKFKRAELLGTSEYYSSSGIAPVIESIDEYAANEDSRKFLKMQKDAELFKSAPRGLAEAQYAAVVDGIRTTIYDILPNDLGKAISQAVKDKYEPMFKDSSFYEQFIQSSIPKAKDFLRFDKNSKIMDEMLKEQERIARPSVKTNKEILQLEASIAESAGRTVEAKIIRNRLDIENKAIQSQKEDTINIRTLEGELDMLDAQVKLTEDKMSSIKRSMLPGKLLNSMLGGLFESDSLKAYQVELDKVIEQNRLDIEAQKAKREEISQLVELQKKLNALRAEAIATERENLISKDIESVTKKLGLSRKDTPELFASESSLKVMAEVKDLLDTQPELVENMAKAQAQYLKNNKDAQEETKKSMLETYDAVYAKLQGIYNAQYDFALALDATLDRLAPAAEGMMSSVLGTVQDFAASVISALEGMSINVNVNAVINAAYNMANSAVGGLLGTVKSAGSSLWEGTKSWLNKVISSGPKQASDNLPPRSSISNFKPGGGGGGKDKKDNLAERNRMLKEIADSEFVADALRKTAFQGYSENEYKKKLEEIQKMKKDGVLKEAEATQYLAAIQAERHRKELEFMRKMESERVKEITQFASVVREAEYNPLLSWSEANGLHEMKIKFAALELAEAYKDIDFKVMKAAESIKLMNDEILKGVGMTREEALLLAKKSGELEKQNTLLKLRKENATGFEKGLLNLPSTKETFDKAKEAFVSTAASGLSEALAAAFNPDVESGGFRRAMSNLGKALRATVIKAFTDALANNLIKGLFSGFLGSGEQKTGGIEDAAKMLGGGSTQGDTLKSTINSLTGGFGSLATSAAQSASTTIATVSADNMATSATYTLAAGLNNAASAAMAFAANVGGSSGGGLLGGLLGSIGGIGDAAGSIVSGTLGAGGFGPAGSVVGGLVDNQIVELGGRFAEGGIVSRPTLAMIGEGGEPEVVAPFSKLDKMINGKKEESKPVQMNIVNVVDPQMVNKAIMNDPNTVVNVIASDINSRGTVYQLMRGKR